MAYVDPDFKHKKELIKALKEGRIVYAYNPGFGGNLCAGMEREEEKEVSIEGPHYPKAHTWYARVMVRRGAAGCVVSRVVG